MAVTAAQTYLFATQHIALGHLYQFGDNALGYAYFNYTYTYPSGPLAGNSVTVKATQPLITTGPVRDGIVDTPGGGSFSPWSLAGQRAPIGYPTYSTKLMYSGAIQPVMLEYEKLMMKVGLTTDLTFRYGRQSGGSFGYKWCKAMLMPVSAIAERVLEPDAYPAKTWIEFTAIFRQVGDFLP